MIVSGGLDIFAFAMTNQVTTTEKTQYVSYNISNKLNCILYRLTTDCFRKKL